VVTGGVFAVTFTICMTSLWRCVDVAMCLVSTTSRLDVLDVAHVALVDSGQCDASSVLSACDPDVNVQSSRWTGEGRAAQRQVVWRPLPLIPYPLSESTSSDKSDEHSLSESTDTQPRNRLLARSSRDCVLTSSGKSASNQAMMSPVDVATRHAAVRLVVHTILTALCPVCSGPSR